VAPGGEPVTFRFDERISERGFSEALVTVSPLDSAVRVERSGTEVRVRIDGGFRPNRVYRVVLLPGLRDLFGNERREQVELVFSTGLPVVSTALAGVVLDRITGAPARQGLVEAVHADAGARYTALADSSGFYSLRYLPLGSYSVYAFDDQNRNRRRDFMEPVDSSRSAVLAAAGDTVTIVFDVLSADTSAPRVGDAVAIDSLHVEVELDDFVDPDALGAVSAVVLALPDSAPAAASVEAISAARFAARSRTDTVVADTTGRRTLLQPAVPSAAAQRLPTREIVITLDRPLPPGTYLIVVSGVTNLHGLTGGGTERFDVAPPPPPPPPPPDTSRSARGP
jgi:hypothetical protein